MKDHIERADAIEAIADYIHNINVVMSSGMLSTYDCIDAAESVLEGVPSAQPDNGYSDGFADGYKRGLTDAHPETANIIVGKSRDGMTMWYQCDNCNEPVDENDLYCRGCGRRFEHGSDR